MLFTSLHTSVCHTMPTHETASRHADLHSPHAVDATSLMSTLPSTLVQLPSGLFGEGQNVVGESLGALVGAKLGASVGASVGVAVGTGVGSSVGCGAFVGAKLGA